MGKKLYICFIFSVLFSSPVFSEDKCTSELDVFNKTQIITGSLLNEMDDPGRLMEMTDYYGEQTKKANELVKEGKYQEACDVYQGVIDKYGFKTMEERYYEKYPEKKPENLKKAEPVNPSESSVSSEAAESATDVSSGE